MLTRLSLAVLAFGSSVSGAAIPQQTLAPSFEVASIRESAPMDKRKIQSGERRAGTIINGASAEFLFVTLADVICSAYNLKSYQVSGTAWLQSQHWDVVATVPAAASPDSVPLMLQTLLSERFKLEFHRDTKEHSVYALSRAKAATK